MKIRQGFVSNSSSSSFHIYGAQVDESEIRKILIEQKKATEEELEEYGVGEFIHELDSPGLACYPVPDWDCVFIGRRYSSIKDDETGRDFKTDAFERVTKFFGEEFECEEHFETTYN